MTVRSEETALVGPGGARAGATPDQDIIKVFLVDSRVLVREGLRALAEQQPDLRVVGGSGTASLGTAYETTPAGDWAITCGGGMVAE